MSVPPFTIDGYVATVSGLVTRGYEIASFHDVEQSRRQLILRHDVDQSITRARILAAVEAAHGWTASYFILLRTEMYNPWSRQAAEDLRAIVAYGHEVGLHLDATCYANDAALEAGARIESDSLEDVIGAPVRVISFHRPSHKRIGSAERIGERIHTYMPQFTQDMGYVSDSRGTWKHGHPWDHPAVRKGGALQLLTHPVWWTGAKEQSPVARLATVADEHRQRIDQELAANSDVWRSRNA